MDISETFELHTPIFVSKYIFNSPNLVKDRLKGFIDDLTPLFENIH
jgi:hypothetical protein